MHRLRLRLQGYLIPFTPLTFVYYRQISSSLATSLLIVLLVSEHLTVTLVVLQASPFLKLSSSRYLTMIMKFLNEHRKSAPHVLNPVSIITWTTGIAAAAGTGFAQSFLSTAICCRTQET